MSVITFEIKNSNQNPMPFSLVKSSNNSPALSNNHHGITKTGQSQWFSEHQRLHYWYSVFPSWILQMWAHPNPLISSLHVSPFWQMGRKIQRKLWCKCKFFDEQSQVQLLLLQLRTDFGESLLFIQSMHVSSGSNSWFLILAICVTPFPTRWFFFKKN